MRPEAITNNMAETGITEASISPRAATVNAKSAPARRRGEYRFLCLLACAAAAGFLTAGCQSDGGGGRGQPGELGEIPAEEYERLVEVGDLPESPEAGTDAGDGAGVKVEHGGMLAGSGESESFSVIPQTDQLDVVFEWPEGQVDFWVKVYGEQGEVAGDFDLDNGEIIQLFSKGEEFTLEVYSKEGGGYWRATYEY
jgi:hypothetical protein